MTILPLPPRDSVTPDSACLLLVPFDAVRRVIATANVTLSEPSTYINLLKCWDFWQIAFNILLLLPFGVYLRYYFKRPWWQVLIFSFMYSLFFELTQLSGLYGIYKYPYRYFEVDDLICNTLGGVLGYVMTPLFVFMLPDRDKLDEIAYRKGQIVSEFRRGVAWCIDMVIIMIPAVVYVIYKHKNLTAFIYDIRYTIAMGVYIAAIFIITTAVSNGRTVGKALVNIRLVRADAGKYDRKHMNNDDVANHADNSDEISNVNNNGEKAHAGNNTHKMSGKVHRRAGIIPIMIRYIILYVISMPSVAYAYYIYHFMLSGNPLTEGWKYYLCIAGIAVCMCIAVYMALDLLLCLFSDTRNMLYDRIAHITHISMSGREYTKINNIDNRTTISDNNKEDDNKENDNKENNDKEDDIKEEDAAVDIHKEKKSTVKKDDINENINLDYVDIDYVDVNKVKELLASEENTHK